MQGLDFIHRKFFGSLLIEHKFVPEVKTPFVFSTGKLILTTIYKPLKTDKQ